MGEGPKLLLVNPFVFAIDTARVDRSHNLQAACLLEDSLGLLTTDFPISQIPQFALRIADGCTRHNDYPVNGCVFVRVGLDLSTSTKKETGSLGLQRKHSVIARPKYASIVFAEEIELCSLDRGCVGDDDRTG